MSGRFSYVSHLECSECDWQGAHAVRHNVCPICERPLLVRYDLDALRSACSPATLEPRATTMWRYHELLPVTDASAVVSLGEPVTPLLRLARLGAAMGVPKLLMKDEGCFPTGSFKGRGAAAGVSRARELGCERLAMPTNGNAGAAWAQYAAKAGLQTLIAMPRSAPAINRAECVVAGAEVYLVEGTIADAGAAIREVVAAGEWFDASTLREPYRIEGKKTMGLEIVEQRGWRMPDVIIYPAGGGVGLIGIHKALRELLELGWIEGDLPRLVAVQSTGCAPVVAAFDEGRRRCEPWPDAQTLAFGINVPTPLGDTLMLDAIADTEGCAIAVDDPAILDALARCGRLEGHFICPEGAATLAALRVLREDGWVAETDEVVILNTGLGSKYSGTVAVDLETVRAGDRLPVAPRG